MKFTENLFLAQAGPTGGVQNSIPSTGTETSKPAVGQGVPNNSFAPLLFPILLLVVFYFLLIRPQQKREKKRKESIKNLKKGDNVLTRGGILGVVSELKSGNIVKLKVGDNTFINANINYIDVVNPIDETKK